MHTHYTVTKAGGGGGGGGDVSVSTSVEMNWDQLRDILQQVFQGTPVKVEDLQGQVSQAVLDALNQGQLKIDWSLLTQAFPDGLPVDWTNMPQYDFAEPTISISRSAGPETPVSADTGVELTITAKDTNHCIVDGHHENAEGPMQVIIDGVQYTASGNGDVVTQTITVNQNRLVTIVAIDGNGNSRQYDVNITNIDSSAPTVKSIEASRDTWTKDPVMVTVDAQDDQKLDEYAYRWYFQSTEDQGSSLPSMPSNPVTDWVSDNTYQCLDSGNVWCEVRDAVGQIVVSPPCYVRCIDKISPEVAGYTLDPGASEFSSPQVGTTVTVDIDNVGDPATKDGSPLAPLMIQWNDGEPWRASTTITVKENCVLNVRVRDSLGNESTTPYPITVSNVADAKPRITGVESSATTGEFVSPPVFLKVYAEKGSGGTAADLADKPFSWDGGYTWLLPNDVSGGSYRSDFTVTHNGQYTIMVRDALGTITEQTVIVSNIDDVAPAVNIYTYKDLPDDWDRARDGDGSPDDFVWRLRVTATDQGSGLDHVDLHFGGESAAIDPSQLPFHMELQEPGIYAVTAYDKAGNNTYAEKSITYEAMGEAGGAGAHTYVDIKTPPEGTAGAVVYGASIGDCVYTKEGVYHIKSNQYYDYSSTVSGFTGIEVHFTITAPSTHWMTGYATFGSGRYEVEVNGNTTGERGFRDMPCVVRIPASALIQDVKNGRLIIVMQEYSDNPGGSSNPNNAKLQKEGTATLYANVQVSPPKINYTYNRSTDELTVIASSAVAGIKEGFPTYNVGGGEITYVTAFRVNGATQIVLHAVDNCQLESTLTLDGATLPVTGEGGGSLPTQNVTDGSGVNSYYMSGRSAEMYIIGGTKQNTNNVPSGSVINSILGTP